MADAMRPFFLSPDEKTELEQKITAAEQSTAKSALPGTVVDLFAWLRGKLDAAGDAEPIDLDLDLDLDPERADELERALTEADEDLQQGRHVPREAVFPRSLLAG